MEQRRVAATAAFRLLALVQTVICRGGRQHVAHPAVTPAGGVEVKLSGNAKRHHECDRFADMMVDDFAAVGLSARVVRTLVLEVATPDAEAMAQSPSAEAVGYLVTTVLRERMLLDGFHERVRVQGTTTPDGGFLQIEGGFDERVGAVNARAVAFVREWLRRHLPEFQVAEGRHHVTKLGVWIEEGTVRRALRVTKRDAVRAA